MNGCVLVRKQRRIRRWLIPFLGVLLMSAWPLSSTAQIFTPQGGNLKLGNLQVHPSLQIQETYSSNIYQNYGGLAAQSGLISTISPAVKLLLPVSRHEFFAEYKADFNLYSVDSETNYIQQRAGGGAKFQFSHGLDMSLTYYYLDSEIPRRSKTGLTEQGIPDEFFRSRPYNQDDFKGLVGWTFADRWRAEGFYSYLDYKFKNSLDSFSNYNNPLYGARLFYRLTAKMSVLGEYNYQVVTYPDDSAFDYKTQLAYLGLAFDPAAKLNGELKFGYENTKYEQSLPGQADSITGTALDVNLTYKLNDRSSLKLLSNRAIRADIDTNAPYTETKVGLEFRHVWSRDEKVSGRIKGSYGTLSFDGQTFDVDGSLKNREDRRWDFGVGIGYDLKRWLTMGLGYDYVNNSSNFITYDYRENRFSFNLQASF